MDKPLLFLMNLAFKSRIPLSFLITMCFLALDLRMQLEINLRMNRLRRPAYNEWQGGGRGNLEEVEDEEESANSGDYSTGESEEESDATEATEESNEGVPGPSSRRSHRRRNQREYVLEESDEEDDVSHGIGISVHLDALRLSR